MLRIDKGPQKKIKIDHDTVGITIEMESMGGSFDYPYTYCYMALTHDEAKQIRDYLTNAYS